MTDDPTEAGRAWIRDELSSAEYFEMVRRQARRDVIVPRWWRRMLERWKR